MMRGPNRVREALRLLEERGSVIIEEDDGALFEIRADLDERDDIVISLANAIAISNCTGVLIP